MFEAEREIMMSKINSLIPTFASFSVSKHVSILLNGINLDSPLHDPRNRLFMLAVQKFVAQTNRFSKIFQ